MRILQISSAKNFGGGEKHLTDLCRGLKEKGHELFVALRPGNVWEERLDFLPRENIRHLPMRNSIDIFSAIRLAKFMREKKIGIIHAHPARDYPVAGLAARLFPPAKLILTRHVLFPMSPLHRLTLRNTAMVIAVSTAAEANLQRIFPRERIALIPNGIDIGRFSDITLQDRGKKFRLLHNIPADAKLVGTIGELKELKGQEDFILAANEVAKRTGDVRFIIVGKDNSFDQSFRRRLKRLVKVFELEEKFTFLDWVEDTAPLLAALDIFVSPSHSESFGLAILEAMAVGNAIVATQTGGAKELLKDKFSGQLVPVKNPVKLAEAIGSILEDPEQQILLGENAGAFARENFSLEKMVRATEELYRTVLEQ